MTDATEKARARWGAERQKRISPRSAEKSGRELRRVARTILRQNGNDPDRAFRSFFAYLVDDATSRSVFSAFIRATKPYADAGHDMEKDAHAFLAEVARAMPRLL